MFSEQETAREETANSESNEIQRFEILRSELMELEQRVQKSADHFEFEEVHFSVLSENYYPLPFVC